MKNIPCLATFLLLGLGTIFYGVKSGGDRWGSRSAYILGGIMWTAIALLFLYSELTGK